MFLYYISLYIKVLLRSRDIDTEMFLTLFQNTCSTVKMLISVSIV